MEVYPKRLSYQYITSFILTYVLNKEKPSKGLKLKFYCCKIQQKPLRMAALGSCTIYEVSTLYMYIYIE